MIRNNTGRCRLLAVGVALLVIGSPVGLGSAAQAVDSGRPATVDPQSTDNLDASTLAIMRRQEAMQPAVQAIAGEQQREPNSGYAGLAFEAAGLSLYWKGALTSGMGAALAAAHKSAAVQIKPAAHSLNELQEAGRAISARAAVEGADIQLVEYPYDGSGLTIRTLPAKSLRDVQAWRAARGLPAVRSARDIVAETRVRVPVSYAVGTESLELESSRLDDSPPWNGGDYFESWRNQTDFRAGCTTGFGVHSTHHDHSWILTAGHCASMGDEAYQGVSYTASFQDMGPVAYDNWQYDILLINTQGWYKIFDGSSTTTSTKIVHSWGYWVANELVCQSGSTSGTVCGLKESKSVDNVVSCSSPDSDGDCGYTELGLIMCNQVSGQTAARHGDSGGPVFSLDGSGVRAKGISSAGGGSVFLFQDWSDVIREYGVYPNTSSSLY